MGALLQFHKKILIVHPNNLKQGKYFAYIINLRCAQAHVISEVILGMTNLKAIFSKRGWRNGREHLSCHHNGREISLIKLLRGGTCNLIGVDIFATCDKKYGKCVQGTGESSAGKSFVVYFIWKTENPPSSCRRSKYVAGKEIRAGPTCDTSSRETQQFDICDMKAACFSHRQGSVSNLLSYSSG